MYNNAMFMLFNIIFFFYIYVGVRKKTISTFYKNVILGPILWGTPKFGFVFIIVIKTLPKLYAGSFSVQFKIETLNL